MTLHEMRLSKKEQILNVARDYGAHNIRIFGSVARGENLRSSDIDFLVDLDADRTLMDLGGLLMDLTELLGMRVDVATVTMLRPELRERALRDAISL